MQTSFKIRQIISYILTILGILFIILGVLAYYHGKIPSNYTKTTGTVVSIKEYTPKPKSNTYSNPSPQYFPIISFDVNNQSYRFQAAGQYYAPEPSDPNAVGKKVSVSYNPSDPSNTPRLTSDHGPTIFSSLVSGSGLLMWIMAYFLYFRYRKQKPIYAQ